MKHIATLLLLTLAISACDNAPSSNNPKLDTETHSISNSGFDTQVQTVYGIVNGAVDPTTNIVAWKGMPYAKPPVGELRWRAPQKPDSWAGIHQATEFGMPCKQFLLNPATSALTTQGSSEDCLTINIWRPNTSEKNLPVYFWIYGGGNSIGYTSDPLYDGAGLAQHANAVFVSINYRVGPFGWFRSSVLRDGKSALDDSGNYGTLDTIQGLKWVQDNISAFGGNPNNVTIAGESAGGVNVYNLMLSPLADDLFHKAIVQSGGIRIASTTDGDRIGDKMIDAHLNADGHDRSGMNPANIAAYLRSKSADEFMSAYHPNSIGMLLDTRSANPEFLASYLDGTVIHADGIDAMARGDYHKVPVMTGFNAEEIKLFTAFGPAAQQPPCEYQQQATASTNNYWQPLTEAPVNAMLAHQRAIYVYRFDYGAYHHTRTTDPDTGECVLVNTGFNAWADTRGEENGNNWPLLIGASHLLDVPFFLDNASFYGYEGFIFRPDNAAGRQALGVMMRDYVAQFMRTGNPNSEGNVEWQPWVGDGPRIIFDADADQALVKIAPAGNAEPP